MLYVEYHNLKKEYKDAEYKLKKAFYKKEQILFDPFPKATDTSKEFIKTSPNSNKLLDYTIKLEEIELEIEKTKNVLGNKRYYFKLKEKELKKVVDKVLRLSKEKEYDFNNEDVMNTIYWFLYIEHTKIKSIARKLYYSKESIYKKREQIIETLQNITK